jgi:hypothetical protein
MKSEILTLIRDTQNRNKEDHLSPSYVTKSQLLREARQMIGRCINKLIDERKINVRETINETAYEIND